MRDSSSFRQPRTVSPRRGSSRPAGACRESWPSTSPTTESVPLQPGQPRQARATRIVTARTKVATARLPLVRGLSHPRHWVPAAAWAVRRSTQRRTPPPPTARRKPCLHDRAPSNSLTGGVPVTTSTSVVTGGYDLVTQGEKTARSAQRWAAARFTALVTARSDAVTMFGSVATPQATVSPTAHSTYAAAVASPPLDKACSA